jgi:hypothetical protein
MNLFFIKMKLKTTLLLLVLFVVHLTIAQNEDFKTGYLIDNNGKKITCLIQDSDWKQYPDKVTYKLNEDSKHQEATLQTTQEIVIPGVAKLVRATVAIDVSMTNINQYNYKKQPVWEDKTLFLEVIVEGEATLYSHILDGDKRFFYHLVGQPVEQLVHKKYLVSETRIAENNAYKQRLLGTLKCESLSSDTFVNLSYKASSLGKVFMKYNTCKGNTVANYDINRYKKDLVKVKFRTGLNFGKMSVTSSRTPAFNTDFSKEVSLLYGLELELRLPFNKDKNWSMVFAPTVRKYSSETTINTTSPNNPFQDVSVTYNTIQVSLGLRRYFALAGDVKIFVDGFLSVDWSSDGEIVYSISGKKGGASKGATTFGFGVGVNYKKFDLMAVLRTKRDPIDGLSSDFNESSLVLAYQLF